MEPPKVLADLMKPLTQRNIQLATETPEEKMQRIKDQFGLYHGPGKRKKKKKKK